MTYLRAGICGLLSLGALCAHPENFGLRERQSRDQLPRSKASFSKALPKPQRVEMPLNKRLTRNADNEWIIASGWKLIEADKQWPCHGSFFDVNFDVTQWYDATVPGTVLTTLIDRGVYPDPYFGINNLAIPDDLCRKEWLYRVVFDAPPEIIGRHVELLLNGVNYRSAVYLNSVHLGGSAGAFVRGRFDVTSLLKEAGNVLSLRVFPPPNPGIPHEESMRSGGQGPNGGQLCMDGPTFISSEGWDWVPGIRDRNIGIWQDVRLRVTGDTALIDPQVITDLPLPDTDSADITLRVTVRNVAKVARKVALEVNLTTEFNPAESSAGALRVSQALDLEPGETRLVELSPLTHKELRLKNPRLWWPNGYGEPALYRAALRLTEPGGRISDKVSVRFGVRELSYMLTVDAPGRENWRVELNPLRAYAGGKALVNNLDRREVDGKVCVPRLYKGSDASLLAQGNDPAMGPYLVIKVNGVPVFCRGGNWGMDDALKRVSRARLEPALRLHRDAGFTMVRNWTGESTELEFFELCDEYGLLVWNDFWYSTQGYNLEPNDHALFLENVLETVRRYRNHPSLAIWCPRNEGWANEQLEPQIAALLAQEDPTRHYHGNSRLENLRPSGPWSFQENISDYFTKLAYGFNTELGNFAVPTYDTLKTFIPDEDLWPIGDVWYYHDFHKEHKQEIYRKVIVDRYGEPQDAGQFCARAQLVNYESFRGMFEAWNSRLWENTSGLLLWMSHPAWPSMIWQLYSYDFETTGAYFGARKACEPLHVQMNAHDHAVIALNLTCVPLEDVTASLRCYGADGRELQPSQQQTVLLAANAKTACFTARVPATGAAPVLARLTLSDSSGNELSRNDYWLPGKEQFKDFSETGDTAELAVEVDPAPDGNSARVKVANTGDKVVGAVKLRLEDIETGRRVLPACFSDGWFNLLPGEEREIMLEGWAGETKLEKSRVRATCEWR